MSGIITDDNQPTAAEPSDGSSRRGDSLLGWSPVAIVLLMAMMLGYALVQVAVVRPMTRQLAVMSGRLGMMERQLLRIGETERAVGRTNSLLSELERQRTLTRRGERAVEEIGRLRREIVAEGDAVPTADSALARVRTLRSDLVAEAEATSEASALVAEWSLVNLGMQTLRRDLPELHATVDEISGLTRQLAERTDAEADRLDRIIEAVTASQTVTDLGAMADGSRQESGSVTLSEGLRIATAPRSAIEPAGENEFIPVVAVRPAVTPVPKVVLAPVVAPKPIVIENKPQPHTVVDLLPIARRWLPTPTREDVINSPAGRLMAGPLQRWDQFRIGTATGMDELKSMINGNERDRIADGQPTVPDIRAE